MVQNDDRWNIKIKTYQTIFFCIFHYCLTIIKEQEQPKKIFTVSLKPGVEQEKTVFIGLVIFCIERKKLWHEFFSYLPNQPIIMLSYLKDPGVYYHTWIIELCKHKHNGNYSGYGSTNKKKI